MTQRSIYHTNDGRSYTPETFVEHYNQFSSIASASQAMGISRNRLRLIAFRLRERGYPAKQYQSIGINQKRIISKRITHHGSAIASP